MDNIWTGSFWILDERSALETGKVISVERTIYSTVISQRDQHKFNRSTAQPNRKTMDDTGDNRKRSLVDGDVDEFDKTAGFSSKRAAMGAATGDVSSGVQAYLLKMLCPRECVGNIIGKGGSVISELNVTTGARIKISQNNEFFPQTNDRVIVISGSTEKIASALTELITKMIEVRKSNI